LEIENNFAREAFIALVFSHLAQTLNQTQSMKRTLILLYFLPLAVTAQNFYFSLRGGLANYQGDLQAKPVTLSQAKLMGSFGAMYDLSEHFTHALI